MGHLDLLQTLHMSRKSSEWCNVDAEKLPYDLHCLTEELRHRSKTELFEDEETRTNSLRLMRQLIRNEKDLVAQTDDSFLLAFLRARKFDVKRALGLMKNFYTVVGKHPELYRDYEFTDIERTLVERPLGMLPFRDQDGCCVLVMSTRDWEPRQNPLGDWLRALTAGLLVAARSPATQVAGFRVILDFEGFTLRHLPHVSPTYIWIFAEALHNCFPGRFRGVHLVNETYLFTPIWMIVKPLLPRKMKERFHFHGKNMAEFHKFISPDILPCEYGGKMPPFDNTVWRQTISEAKDYITLAFQYGYRKHKKAKSLC